jgi:hypothetical protein
MFERERQKISAMIEKWLVYVVCILEKDLQDGMFRCPP